MIDNGWTQFGVSSEILSVIKEYFVKNENIVASRIGFFDSPTPSTRSLIKHYYPNSIEDQLVLGVSHVIEYIRTETYKYLYNRHIQANVPPPEKGDQKNKKLMRKNSKSGSKSSVNA